MQKPMYKNCIRFNDYIFLSSVQLVNAVVKIAELINLTKQLNSFLLIQMSFQPFIKSKVLRTSCQDFLKNTIGPGQGQTHFCLAGKRKLFALGLFLLILVLRLTTQFNFNFIIYHPNVAIQMPPNDSNLFASNCEPESKTSVCKSHKLPQTNYRKTKWFVNKSVASTCEQNAKNNQQLPSKETDLSFNFYQAGLGLFNFLFIYAGL